MRWESYGFIGEEAPVAKRERSLARTREKASHCPKTVDSPPVLSAGNNAQPPCWYAVWSLEGVANFSLE
jgi:hypothetical protein